MLAGWSLPPEVKALSEVCSFVGFSTPTFPAGKIVPFSSLPAPLLVLASFASRFYVSPIERQPPVPCSSITSSGKPF